MRYGLGPIFALQAARLARRPALHWLRAAISLGLLACLAGDWAGRLHAAAMMDPQKWESLARIIFGGVLESLVIFLLVATPAWVAGAFGAGRVRGPLVHLLATDLSGGSIASAIVAVHALDVLGLALAGLPVAAIVALLGGIAPGLFLRACLYVVGVALLACAASLLCSLRARESRDAVLGAYFIVLLASVLPLVAGDLLRVAGPALVAAGEGSRFFSGLLSFLTAIPSLGPLHAHARLDGPLGWRIDLAYLGAGVVAIGVAWAYAALRLRPIVLRQAFGAPRRHRFGLLGGLRRWISPSPRGNPVLWWSWISRGSSLGGGIAFSGYVWLIGLLASFVAWEIVDGDPTDPPPHWVPPYLAFLGLLGLLLLGVQATWRLAEDRARGAWEGIRWTPLPRTSLAAGYWLGSLAPAAWVLAPGAVAVVELAIAGRDSWRSLPALMAWLLAQSAFWVGVGFRMAGRFPDPGRAVKAFAAAFFAACVGWPMLVQGIGASLGWGSRSPEILASLLGSPSAGICWILEAGGMSPSDPRTTWIRNAAWAWGLAYGLAAAGLMMAFPGRMGEPAAPRRDRPAPRPRSGRDE